MCGAFLVYHQGGVANRGDKQPVTVGDVEMDNCTSLILWNDTGVDSGFMATRRTGQKGHVDVFGSENSILKSSLS